MNSPFPGMDPYLEGYLWPDFHNALAAKIRQILAPRLRPTYTARLNLYVVEDTAPEGDIGILYPDIEIMRTAAAATFERSASGVAATASGATPATLTIPVILPVDVQITTVEIHDTAHNQLITSIEILSPVNKREPGLTTYRQKRQRLYQAGVHLIELDLLRRGIRPILHPTLPTVPYLITLTRAHSGKTEGWPLAVQSRLPTLPIPLRLPDADVLLELDTAFHEVYAEAAYDLSIDYQQAPPAPPLSEADSQWIDHLLSKH